MSRSTDTTQEASWDDFYTHIADGGTVEAQMPLPDDYRNELTKMLRVGGDTELRSVPMIMSYFEVGVPARYVRPLLSIAQDELGHAHINYQLLESFGIDTRELIYSRPAAGWTAPYVFDAPISSWPEIAVIEGLGEYVGGLLVRNVLQQCNYGPWRRALGQVVADERFHVKFGQRIMTDLAVDDDNRRQLQQAVDWIFPLLLELFGPPPRRNDRQIELGLKAQRVDALRQDYLNWAAPFAESIGITLPAKKAEDSRYELDCAFPCAIDIDAKTADLGTEVEWSAVFERWRGGGPRAKQHLEWLRSAHSGTAA